VDDTKPSKSARKRAYLALQKLGEELVTLREADLQAIPLDEELREAVMEARRIKAHGALRRQKQYIGKLMGRVDPEPIREALERLRRNS
jgi:ribosome-associated protein